MKKLILLVALLGTSSLVEAQKFRVNHLSVAFMSESISFPFTRFSPLHPGGEIGLNLREVHKDKSIRRVNVYLGGYYNQEIEIGFYLRGEYQYLYKITPWLGLDGSIGMGYLHTFFPSDLYEQNEDGSFREINQGGRPHLLINLGIGLNYLNKSRFQPFIRQDLGLETPFANTVPIVPKSFVKIGTFIQINQTKQND